MSKKELEPCPFCGLTITTLNFNKFSHGKTEKVLDKADANRFSRMCANLKCKVLVVTLEYVTQELADAAWDTRPESEA